MQGRRAILHRTASLRERPLAEDDDAPIRPPLEGEGAEIRTFLIADVRGYTVFTQERGDEAAARLARRFATIAREAVDARGGEVIELRGDEALAVFVSARQAIRAAVDLQQRFVEETLRDPSLPLPVGIGLDAGEAVRMEGGYRGGALNLAARLCGHAGAGEILASREVVHLARKVEGVRFGATLDLTLKGLSDPVRAVKVLPEEGDPAEILGPFAPARSPPEPPPGPAFPRSLVSSTPRLVAVIVALALVALGIPLVVSRLGPTPVEIGERPVGMLDLPSGRVIAAVDTGEASSAVAFGEGAVWVASTGGTVSRIDPEQRRVVQEIPVPQDPAGIAVGEGAVWVTSARERTVSRINPASNTVVKSIEVGNGPSGVAVGGGGVWVANTFDNAVVRIDPGTDEVTHTFPVTGSPSGITFGFAAAWVANETEATVSRIDPATGTVTPIHVGNGPRHVLAAAGGVWVANRLDGTVTKIDPTTNRVAFTLPAGDEPAGIAADADGVWVASELGASVKRIEADGAEGETLDLEIAVLGLELVQDSLWFTSRGAPTSHRGGTLTLVSALETPSIDRSLAPLPLHAVVGDGLVGYKRVGGVDGTSLVPGLAVALPTPTDGGRTYTFRLRPGILYSNGEPVVASDFRRAIERVFRLEGFDAPIYAKIVGAEACMAKPASCNLTAGIQADDEAGTITFRLSVPDPVLLHTLAFPTSYPIPEGTPDEDVGTSAVPGTGPYTIASFVPRERIVLERNPHFRPWPHRPDGFADRIVVVDGVPPEDLVAEVLEGRADGILSPALIPPEQLDRVMTERTEQAHTYTRSGTFMFFLNTELPPFADLRVRKAVNYAVDRERIVELFPFPASLVTCQILPPGFTGYRPYCPYTVDPDPAGTWTAPDVPRAKKLVAASGTREMEVEVWAFPAFERVVAYFVSVLEDLGYRARLRVIEDPLDFFDFVIGPSNQLQAGGFTWLLPNRGSPDEFISLLTCEEASDPSRFCDPSIDRRIARARRVQLEDPAAAGPLWAAIDRALVDQAPWVAAITPGWVDVVSERLGNYQPHPVWGMLPDQVWVR